MEKNPLVCFFLVFSVWNKSHSATCDVSSKLLLTHGSWKASARLALKVEGNSQNMKYFFILHHPVFKSLHRVHRYKTSRALFPFPGCVSLPSPPDEWTSLLTAPGFYRQTSAFASHLCKEQLSQWRGSPLAVTDQSALCPSERRRGLGGRKRRGKKKRQRLTASLRM